MSCRATESESNRGDSAVTRGAAFEQGAGLVGALDAYRLELAVDQDGRQGLEIQPVHELGPATRVGPQHRQLALPCVTHRAPYRYRFVARSAVGGDEQLNLHENDALQPDAAAARATRRDGTDTIEG